MWSARQATEKEPSLPTVALAVGAHCQPVSCPERSISTVAPLSERGAEPVNVTWLLRNAEAAVTIVIPLPLALTLPLPGCDDGEFVVLLDPLGASPPPPEKATPAAGSDS